MTSKTVRRAAALMATVGVVVSGKALAQSPEPSITGQVRLPERGRMGEFSNYLPPILAGGIGPCMDMAPEAAVVNGTGAFVGCIGSDNALYGGQQCNAPQMFNPADPNSDGIVECVATILGNSVNKKFSVRQLMIQLNYQPGLSQALTAR